MAKVLVSTLGNGPTLDSDDDYSTALYRFDDSENQYETSFVATAIAKEIKADKIFMIGTAESMWEKVYEEYSGKNYEDEYWFELAKKVDDSTSENNLLEDQDFTKLNKSMDHFLNEISQKAEGGSKGFIINYGLNDQELWENFDIFMDISERLNDGDEIYLDITHAFRSIPIFMYLMMDFIQNINDIDIKLSGLYYGMLAISSEKGYAPVVDLSPLFKISKWIRGTNEFINYGNGYIMSELIDDDNISDKIKNISDLVNINYLKDLRSQIDSLNNLLENKKYKELKVLKYLMPYLRDFISRFQGLDSHSLFQLKLSKWYFENKRYANGYICLTEAMLTKVAEEYKNAGNDLNIYHYSDRAKVKKAITKLEYKDLKYKQLYQLYDDINTDIRNVIAHAGFIDSGNYSDAVENWENNFKDIKKEFFNKNLVIEIPKVVPFKEIR